MTRCLTTCSVEIMRPEQYDIPCGDEDEEYDDDFDDDDELDGYDGFSDLDDGEIEDGRPVAYHGNGLDDERARNVSRRHRSMSEGSELILEAGDDNRRDHHNQLERKRRASIKTSYNDLREAIPSLRGSKASRAVILQRAVECIEELVKRNRDHTHCVETLRRQNDLLDSRVQELQRTVQRLEGEEAATASLPLGTTIGPPTMNGTLRLYSGTLAASGSSGSCSSSLPIYRLMPQDSSDRPVTAHGSQTIYTLHSTSGNRSGVHGGATHGSVLMPSSLPSRTRISPALSSLSTNSLQSSAFSGINILSAAASLVASSHSAFFSTSSGGSTSEPAQSSSQRSSPGCLSSSLSNTSSSLQSTSHPTEQIDEQSLVLDTTCTGDIESSDRSIARKTKPKNLQVIDINPDARPSSPPSILLTVPVRSSTTAFSADGKSRQHQSYNVLATDSESAFKLGDLSKRQRIN